MTCSALALAVVSVACAPPVIARLQSPATPSSAAPQVTATPPTAPLATESTTAPQAIETPAPTAQVVQLIGAGDIASCASDGDEATALLLDAHAGTVFTAGDNAYETGSERDFAQCYERSWGRHRTRTRPVPGSHEYLTPGARGYFAYFGSLAGDPSTGWYSYRLGSWLIFALNSNCSYTSGCYAGSPQERWLRAELAAGDARCALAYWHHPRFSSGEHGNHPFMTDFWRALHAAGADIVVVGHDHHYERFAPQDPAGRLDPARGIRQFVVGTGGASLRKAAAPVANSEALRDDVFGVLKLTLRPDGYGWEFIAADGRVVDAGDGRCH